MELMVTMAVVAIAIALASPALAALVEAHAASGARHRLTTSLAFARLAAIKHGHAVTVCPSSDGARCRRDGVWDEGWLVYADADKQQDPVTPESLLEVSQGVSGGITVRSPSSRSRVRFSPWGWSAGHNLTIELCTPRHGATHRLIVNNAGRPRTERLPANTPCAE